MKFGNYNGVILAIERGNLAGVEMQVTDRRETWNAWRQRRMLAEVCKTQAERTREVLTRFEYTPTRLEIEDFSWGSAHPANVGHLAMRVFVSPAPPDVCGPGAYSVRAAEDYSLGVTRFVSTVPLVSVLTVEHWAGRFRYVQDWFFSMEPDGTPTLSDREWAKLPKMTFDQAYEKSRAWHVRRAAEDTARREFFDSLRNQGRWNPACPFPRPAARGHVYTISHPGRAFGMDLATGDQITFDGRRWARSAHNMFLMARDLTPDMLMMAGDLLGQPTFLANERRERAWPDWSDIFVALDKGNSRAFGKEPVDEGHRIEIGTEVAYWTRLTSKTALDQESARMDHCVGYGSYDRYVKGPLTRDDWSGIWSLRQGSGAENRSRVTVEIDRQRAPIHPQQGIEAPIGAYVFRQAKCKDNARPGGENREYVQVLQEVIRYQHHEIKDPVSPDAIPEPKPLPVLAQPPKIGAKPLQVVQAQAAQRLSAVTRMRDLFARRMAATING